MHHGTRAFLLAIALTAAVSPALPAQTVMTYKFKDGDRLLYLLEQKTKSLMSLAGTDIEMKVNVTMTMAWQVLKVDSRGHAQVQIKVTHSKMSMDSLLGIVEVDSKDKDGPGDLAGKMVGQMNKAIAAMEITATMLPTGEMQNLKVSDNTVKAMAAIPGASQLGDLASPDNFKDMISGIVFPTEAITKGKSWSNRSETKSPSGTISADNVYTLEGTVTRDGATLEKIALKPIIKVEGDPKATLKLKGIKATGETLFDNKAGRVVESSLFQSKEGQIKVMGLVLDSLTEEKTTIRLLKQNDAVDSVAGNSIVSVKIDEEEYVEKVVAKEPLETLAGVSRTFTVERSYEPQITIPAIPGGGADSAVAGELKGKVEAALGITIGKKTPVKEAIALDGKEITKVNVQWVERSRRGIATRSDGSTVAFLVRVGLTFKLEKAK